VRRQAELRTPERDLFDRNTERLGQRAIALAGQGKELAARHQQRAGEPLRPPLIERPQLEPGGHLEGGQRQSAGQAHQRLPLPELPELEQRRVELEIVRPSRAAGRPS
jgi:hypothetical protein